MGVRPLSAGVAASLLLIALDTFAAVTAWTEIAVRVYDAAGLSRPVRARALAAARDALVTASVEVVWIDCAERGACERPPDAHELIVRLVTGRGPGAVEHTPLGSALVDAGGHTGVLATVYVDRVRGVAATLGADESVLLGRATAHELGHLLMGSSTHARAGLMREKWTLTEIRRDRREDWIFSAAEATRIARVGRRFHVSGVKPPVDDRL